MVDGFRYPLATRHPHVTTPGNRQLDRSRRGGHFVASLFGRYSSYGSKGIVRRAYAGRTQFMVLSWAFSLAVSFSCGFHGDLAFSSRISTFPQILGLGWYSLDGNLPIWAVRGCPLVVLACSPWMGSSPILFLVLPLRVSLVRNCFVPPPLPGQRPSCWTSWFTLRSPLLPREPWGGCTWGTPVSFWKDVRS